MPTNAIFTVLCFSNFRHTITMQQCRFLHIWNNNLCYITYSNSFYCQWTIIIFLFFKLKCFNVTLNLIRKAFNASPLPHPRKLFTIFRICLSAQHKIFKVCYFPCNFNVKLKWMCPAEQQLSRADATELFKYTASAKIQKIAQEILSRKFFVPQWTEETNICTYIHTVIESSG